MDEFDFLGAFGVISLLWVFIVAMIVFFMNGRK